MKNQKSLYIVLGLIIIAVVAIGYFVFPVSKVENHTLETTQKVKPDETADWQTYQNEKFGFEMKYPKTWKVVTSDADEFGVSFQSPENIKGVEAEIKNIKESGGVEGTSKTQANITIYFRDTLKDFAESSSAIDSITSLEDMIRKEPTFNNIRPYSIPGLKAFRANEEGLFTFDTILLEKNSRVFKLIIGSHEGMTPELETKILSTFKFTK